MRMYWETDDEVILQGTDYRDKDLLGLMRCGKSPFDGIWDSMCLIQEIEECLNVQVVDIPRVYNGRYNYVSKTSTVYGIVLLTETEPRGFI